MCNVSLYVQLYEMGMLGNNIAVVVVRGASECAMCDGRQLSKLSFVQFSDAAAVHKGPVGIKNGMMLLDSQSLAWADLGRLDQISNFVQKFSS